MRGLSPLEGGSDVLFLIQKKKKFGLGHATNKLMLLALTCLQPILSSLSNPRIIPSLELH